MLSESYLSQRFLPLLYHLRLQALQTLRPMRDSDVSSNSKLEESISTKISPERQVSEILAYYPSCCRKSALTRRRNIKHRCLLIFGILSTSQSGRIKRDC